MSVPWWLVPRWLDLELARYLAACEVERQHRGDTRGGEDMAKDNRTQQEKQHAKVGTPTKADVGRQRDAQKQGPAGQPKR